MATSLPVTIDADYPDDGSPSRKTHQQHHDALHGYTNSHDTAADPHGDRAAASSALTAHTAAADPHTVYVKKVGGDTITASSAAVVPLVVKGASGQTGNLLEARDNGGVLLTRIRSGGNIGIGHPGADTTGLTVQARAATDRCLQVYGTAGQSGNLIEVGNSSGVVLGGFSPTGQLIFDTAQSTATATGGANGALPSQVAGYMTVRDQTGTVRKIAYYNA